MPNISNYMEIESKRKLLKESFDEISHLFRYPDVGNSGAWAVALVLFGWCVSFVTVLSTCDLSFLKTRKPNKAVFFAAFNEKIRKVFRRQRPDTFATIAMGANRVLTDHTPEEPTVLMFLVPRGAMPTARALVLLVANCLLMSRQCPARLRHIRPLLVNGSAFRSNTDDWPFFLQLRKPLHFPGVAAVFAFERVHPQAVRALQALVPMVYAPYPQSVLMLIADVGDRFNPFNHHNTRTMSPNEMGKVFLREQLAAYFDESELTYTISLTGSRCIVVNPEDHVEDFET